MRIFIFFLVVKGKAWNSGKGLMWWRSSNLFFYIPTFLTIATMVDMYMCKVISIPIMTKVLSHELRVLWCPNHLSTV